MKIYNFLDKTKSESYKLKTLKNLNYNTGHWFCEYASAKPLFPISKLSLASVTAYTTYGWMLLVVGFKPKPQNRSLPLVNSTLFCLGFGIIT